MTPSHYLVIASAVLGALGTAALFKGTWAFEPFEGGIWGSEKTKQNNAAVRTRNSGRQWYQRVGLTLLVVSFIFQGIAALVP